MAVSATVPGRSLADLSSARGRVRRLGMPREGDHGTCIVDVDDRGGIAWLSTENVAAEHRRNGDGTGR